jgi:flagellum-specific ATP synthase
MDKVFRVYGKVVKVSGVYLEATVPEGAVGNQCIIKTEAGDVEGEVIGFHENRCLIMPFGSLLGVKTGDRVWIRRETVSTVVGEKALGQILDPFGRKISDGRLIPGEKRPIELKDINPLQRERIREVFDTGVRTIDALFTLGRGERLACLRGRVWEKPPFLG